MAQSVLEAALKPPFPSHGVINTLLGFRNGAYYGTKIRMPHAAVMTFLFAQGSLRDKARRVVSLTFEHTRNLAVFVLLYKATHGVLRAGYDAAGAATEGGPGTPARGWHALVAGAVGAHFVWAKYTSVNYQIVMYLFSRIIIAQVRLLAAKGVQPFARYAFKDVYPYLATGTWAIVMWLFERHRATLHPSLAKSMDFLYHDSNKWSSPKDFLPSPATALVCAATWLSF